MNGLTEAQIGYKRCLDDFATYLNETIIRHGGVVNSQQSWNALNEIIQYTHIFNWMELPKS